MNLRTRIKRTTNRNFEVRQECGTCDAWLTVTAYREGIYIASRLGVRLDWARLTKFVEWMQRAEQNAAQLPSEDGE